MCCSWYGNDASVQPVLPPDENSVFLYVLWRMGMHMQHVSLPLLICSWYSHARGCIARVLKCSTPVVFRKIIYISWWASSNRHVVCSMFLATRCLARALGARAAPSYSMFAICLGFFSTHASFVYVFVSVPFVLRGWWQFAHIRHIVVIVVFENTCERSAQVVANACDRIPNNVSCVHVFSGCGGLDMSRTR